MFKCFQGIKRSERKLYTTRKDEILDDIDTDLLSKSKQEMEDLDKNIDFLEGYLKSIVTLDQIMHSVENSISTTKTLLGLILIVNLDKCDKPFTSDHDFVQKTFDEIQRDYNESEESELFFKGHERGLESSLVFLNVEENPARIRMIFSALISQVANEIENSEYQ